MNLLIVLIVIKSVTAIPVVQNASFLVIHKGYSNCPISFEPCVDPWDEEGTVCHRNGECTCGKCICSSRAPHFGEYCKKTPVETAKGEQFLSNIICKELKKCVQCQVHHTGEYEDDEDCEIFCIANPKPTIVYGTLKLAKDEKLCEFVDDMDGCTFYFAYGNFSKLPSDTNNRVELYIRAEQLKTCPPDPPSQNPTDSSLHPPTYFTVNFGIGWILFGVLSIVFLCFICILMCVFVSQNQRRRSRY